MKKTVFIAAVLLLVGCASNTDNVANRTSGSNEGPEVYGSVRMGVERGKVSGQDSYIGVKNF